MTKQGQTIDEQYSELQGIVDEFEKDEVDLEKSLPKFKKGLELAAEIKKKLEVLKNEVEEIKDSFEEKLPKVSQESTDELNEDQSADGDIPF